MEKMKIWIKVNDSWGYVGVSRDNVDNHMSSKEITELLGGNFEETVHKINNTNYLTDELVGLMLSKGWFEDDSSFRSNGDVHAFAFTN